MFQLLPACKANRTTGLSAVTALFGFMGFALAAPSVQAQDTPKPEPTYSVQRTYKAGETDHYKYNVNNQTLVLTMLMKESTASVTPDGTVTVEDVYEEASAESNGEQQDLTAYLPKLILITDKKGHLKVKTEGGNEQIADRMVTMVKQMGSMQTLVLPVKPVKVGESWNPDMSKMDAESGAKTTMTVKLEAVETLHGVKALKLKSVMDSVGGKDPNAKLHVEATTYVDAQTGKAIKLTSKTEGTVNGDNVASDTVMERAEPDEKKETKPASDGKKDPGAKKDTGDKKP